MKGRDISSLSDDGYCHGEKVALFSACSPHKSFFAYRYAKLCLLRTSYRPVGS